MKFHALVRRRPLESCVRHHLLDWFFHPPMNHTFTLVLAGGLVYLFVWCGYRMFRHAEHARYLSLHTQERLLRVKFDVKNPGSAPNPQEQLRRAEWDVEHGPLMYPLEIKNREENRWPIGNALQGLAALVTGLFVAALIWDFRAGPDGGGNRIIPAGGPAASTAGMAPSSGLDSVFLLSLVLVASGGIFWRLSNTRAGRYTGGALILTASLLSGLKILNVEKLVAINEAVGIHLPPPAGSGGADTRQHDSYSLSIPMPPFASASAAPTPLMLCALRRVSAEVTTMQGLFSVVVVARADRQELKPAMRKLYSSNWALAQQRGIAIEKLLAPGLPPGASVQVANSGPINTSGPADPDLMELDRSPSLQFSGFGAAPEALRVLQRIEWPVLCKA